MTTNLQRTIKQQLRDISPGQQIVIAYQVKPQREFRYELETVTKVDSRYIYTQDADGEEVRYHAKPEYGGTCTLDNKRWISINQHTGELRSIEWFNEWKQGEDKRNFVSQLRSYNWNTLDDAQLNAIRRVIVS
jgi:hypothetical protein